MHSRRSRLLITLVSALVALPATAQASPGDLDPAFGTGGMVVTEVPPSHQVIAMALQPDGKIVAAGYGGAVVALARYETDGTLDTSFGSGGVVVKTYGQRQFDARALAFQPDGKIVVAGMISRLGHRGRIAVARFDADGTVDRSFDSNGLAITPRIGPDHDAASAVAFLDGGGILVGGTSSSVEFVLVKYEEDGALDTSFAGDGIATTSVGIGNSSATSMGLQSDGKIVVGGRGQRGDGFTDFALARFNTDGTLDDTFGSNGTVLTNVGNSWEEIQALVVQPDDKIVVGGYANRSYAFKVARYLPDGTLDTSFSADGIVLKAMGGPPSFGVEALVRQPDGKLVAAGSSDSLGTPDFALVRYEANGRLDEDFGSDGVVRTDFGGYDEAFALLLQSDGRLVAGGTTTEPARSFALARYMGS